MNMPMGCQVACVVALFAAIYVVSGLSSRVPTPPASAPATEPVTMPVDDPTANDNAAEMIREYYSTDVKPLDAVEIEMTGSDSPTGDVTLILPDGYETWPPGTYRLVPADPAATQEAGR